MRYLHSVQAHEKFLASGRYRFFKNGVELAKAESWSIHELGDQSQFIRVDLDARTEEGKSILAEMLINPGGQLARFDIRYENSKFDGGIKALRATYQFDDDRLQVGYSLNDAERRYQELELPPDVLVDMPMLVTRGAVLQSLTSAGRRAVQVFVPMFEHAQLFPGRAVLIQSPVEYAGDEALLVGGKERHSRRYRYVDKALCYWVDEKGVVVKRVNAYKQDEFVVTISDYAQRAG